MPMPSTRVREETLPTETTTAYLAGDELVLEEFRERDPDVVAFARESDDVESAAHRCLAMGARVLRLSGATLDSELVEHRFAEMTSDLDRQIISFADRVEESAKGLLDDEDGELALALRKWMEDTETLLGSTFDETSKKSAIAKVEKVLEDARDEQVRAMKRLLDSDNEDSPFGRWRDEIVKTIKENSSSIENALDELREQLQVKSATAAEHEKTAIKGFDFEQDVLACIESLVTPHEDVPEHVGEVTGSAASKTGDIVVNVNPADTPGRTVRYVIEVKDKAMPLKRALDELDAAIRNRDAHAGVMVFASPTSCPSKEPFQCFDHKAIVVLDKETMDAAALRLACLWARWTAAREVAGLPYAFDLDHVRGLLDAARRSLKTVTSVKGDHTKAKKAIDDASRHIAELQNELTSTLDLLELELETPETD